MTNKAIQQRKAISVKEANRKRLSEDKELRWDFKAEAARLDLAVQIRALMSELELSQSSIAERSGTTQPMISRLLNSSDDRSPTLETIVKVADGLDRDVRVVLIERAAEDCCWRSDQASPTSTNASSSWESGAAPLLARDSCTVLDLSKWASAASHRISAPQERRWLAAEASEAEVFFIEAANGK